MYTFNNKGVVMNTIRPFFILLSMSLVACNMSLAGNPPELSKGHGNYHPVGKPHAPIEMTFQLPSKLKPGQAIEFTFSLMPTQDVESLSMQMRVDDGLVLKTDTQAGYGVMSKGAKADHVVKLVSQREGLFYVHVQASVKVAGQIQSRSFVIPLNVGDVDARKYMKSSGRVTEEAGGERIISMPAQESAPAK
jgi:hypothetical protein